MSLGLGLLCGCWLGGVVHGPSLHSSGGLCTGATCIHVPVPQQRVPRRQPPPPFPPAPNSTHGARYFVQVWRHWWYFPSHAKVHQHNPKKGLYNVRGFFWVRNFYHRHIKIFTYTRAILTDLMKKSTEWASKGVRPSWTHMLGPRSRRRCLDTGHLADQGTGIGAISRVRFKNPPFYC